MWPKKKLQSQAQWFEADGKVSGWREPHRSADSPVSRGSRYVVILHVDVFNVQAVTEEGEKDQKEQRHQRRSGPAEQRRKERHVCVRQVGERVRRAGPRGAGPR